MNNIIPAVDKTIQLLQVLAGLYSGIWFAQRGRKGLHKLCCRCVNQLSKSG